MKLHPAGAAAILAVGLDLGEAVDVYESWDVDRDHLLARDEFFGPGTYPDLDADADGFLDTDEFIRR